MSFDRWDWRAREHATNLIHGIKSTRSSATTWCERHIIVKWTNWTEMPPLATITCLRCVEAMIK